MAKGQIGTRMEPIEQDVTPGWEFCIYPTAFTFGFVISWEPIGFTLMLGPFTVQWVKGP